MATPDRHHRLLQRLIDQAQPQSFEELQELLNTLAGSPLPGIPEEELTDEDRAFDLVDEAWDSSPAKGRKLAVQALELWPDCIPAYEYLFVSIKSKKQRLEYIENAVEIGKRLFGGKYLKEHIGNFWNLVETRPYMRSLHALAEYHAGEGNLSNAIVIWEDIIRLNTDDNLGVRYSLLSALLRQRDLKSYSKYCKKYPEDTTPYLFNDALVHFMKEGASAEANEYLKNAAVNNSYAIPLLLHDAPPSTLPDSYALHSPEEAIIYADETWQLWREIPGALEWLKASQLEQKKRGKAQPLVKLSRESLSLLLSDPFSPVSPLQLRPDLKDEDVAQVPFVQLTREVLAAIHEEQPLKLTQKGNLPRALVQKLYGLRLFPNKFVDDGSMKLLREEDFPELVITHTLCIIAKWALKRNGKISLTKKGLKILQEPQALFYRELLKTYTQEYYWGYTDRWSFDERYTGQAGWAMMLYELLRQGDTPQSDTYFSGVYFQILPHLMEYYEDLPYSSATFQAQSDFRFRFFKGFTTLFGLADIISETRGQYDILQELVVKRSELAERAFRIL